MTAPRQELGRRAEDAAAKYLEKKGYRILERNLRNRLGEIDLIAESGGCVVFVEVKSGAETPGFSPVDHFTPQKQRKLLQLGKAYLAGLPREKDARFDLISVTESGGQFRIDHLEDVIQDAP